ncbi:unnamed protein product [Arabis nemorensis]|uniref:Miraculin-like n=1 Tax=Arabis nemorensis TaxID=586526 RepID=A0A565B2L5_9BRAS|nr:unnamed protein product [Arabis nemorensis]
MSPMFYFFLALTAVLAATASALTPVLDTDGDIIFHGRYYVLPVFRGQGGGVTLTNPNFRPCPRGHIVQEKSEVENGIPVRFSNWKPRVGFVPETEDLNIKTDSGQVLCRRDNYWRVDEFDTGNKNWFLVSAQKPTPDNAFRSYFQIQKVGNNLNAYKIMFCPGACIDVGIFVDENSVRRLALTNEPFLVMFKKANETTTTMVETM